MSTESTPRSKTRGLLAHAQQKSEETQKRVHQSIDQLVREQHPVNFNTVAKAAHVTKSYLYAHRIVRERIEALRTQQGQEQLKQKHAHQQQHPGRTDITKDVLLEARSRRIKALEEENRRLKEELKVAYGKLYERI